MGAKMANAKDGAGAPQAPTKEEATAQGSPEAPAPSTGTYADCLSFINNVSKVNQRCTINYEFRIPPSEIPAQFRDIISSPHINAINGEETAKFISEDDKKVRRQLIDIVRAQYLTGILDTLGPRGTHFGSKNASWKTRDSYYAMLRCTCGSQRLVDNTGRPIFVAEDFDGLASDKPEGKFKNLKSITDVVGMWMAENAGETVDFVETRKKPTVSASEMDQFIHSFKHLEEANSYSSIEFLKVDEKFNPLGNCPACVSFTFKLSALEFKLRVKYFPHDPAIELRNIPRTKRRKLKAELPESAPIPVETQALTDQNLATPLEASSQTTLTTPTHRAMDLNFINNSEATGA